MLTISHDEMNNTLNLIESSSTPNKSNLMFLDQIRESIDTKQIRNQNVSVDSEILFNKRQTPNTHNMKQRKFQNNENMHINVPKHKLGSSIAIKLKNTIFNRREKSKISPNNINRNTSIDLDKDSHPHKKISMKSLKQKIIDAFNCSKMKREENNMTSFQANTPYIYDEEFVSKYFLECSEEVEKPKISFTSKFDFTKVRKSVDVNLLKKSKYNNFDLRGVDSK